MSQPSHTPDWSPLTPPFMVGDIEGHLVVVLHYWACWDYRNNREMDKRLVPLRAEYRERICFRSCDTDRAENRPFIQGVANIPALGCFIRGKSFESLIGLRTEDELREGLNRWLSKSCQR